MNSSNRTLKQISRVQLSNSYITFALITLAVTFVNFGLIRLVDHALPYRVGFINQLFYMAATVITNMAFYLVWASAIRIYYKFCNGQKFKISELLFAFNNNPEQIAIYSVVQCALHAVVVYGGLRIWGYYLSDTSKYSFSSTLLITIIAVAWYIWIQLHLSMVLFIYSEDSTKSAIEMIIESMTIIRGHKKQLFFLVVSFAGVYLLGILSIGVGLLFAKPYLYTTLCNFYLQIKNTEA